MPIIPERSQIRLKPGGNEKDYNTTRVVRNVDGKVEAVILLAGEQVVGTLKVGKRRGGSGHQEPFIVESKV